MKRLTRPTMPCSRFGFSAGLLALGAILAPWTELRAQAYYTPGPTVISADRDKEEAQRIREQDQAERDRIFIQEQQEFLDDEWIESSPKNQKDLILFPVLPPALADARPDFPVLPYPGVLADYAGEPFFMAHGSLRFRGLLKSAQRQRLEQYCATRDGLVAALRARLAETATQGPDAQRQSLAEFAAAQRAELHALESEADAIRTALTALDRGTALAQQRDTVQAIQTPGLRNYLSAILAAHFYDGLSLEQRQLLHEVALESIRASRAGSGPAPVFFLPAPARVRWPALPDTIAPAVERFNQVRTALREELLRTVVYDQEKLAAKKRTAKYAAFAAQQAASFDELHRLAEEIRTMLADLPHPAQPTPSALPPELIRQVGEAVARKGAFQVATSRRLRELNRGFAPARLKLLIEHNEPVIQLYSAGAGLKPPTGAQLARLAAARDEIRRDYQATTAMTEAARVAVERYRETLGGDNVPAVSTLLADLADTYERAEIWRRFADYRAAVELPGLSPAQRRLLFNAALRDLEKHRLATTE